MLAYYAIIKFMSKLKKYTSSIAIKFSIIGELFGYLWENKMWWAIPIIFIVLVVMAVLFFAQSTGLAPFIYPFF